MAANPTQTSHDPVARPARLLPGFRMKGDI